MSRTRGTWNTPGVWAAGVAFAAVVGLTGYAALSGGDGGSQAGKGKSASPAASSKASAVPTYQAPDGWTEPDRWAALPRGERTDKYSSQVGFPHTTDGAVAMLAAAQSTNIDEQKTTVDEHLRVYHSYIAAEDQSETVAERVELGGQQSDKTLHQQMGAKPGGPLPSGAYVRTTVVGFKVIKESSGEVSAWLLSRVAQKNGETAKEGVTYTRSVEAARWEHGDWKISAEATVSAQQQTQGQTAPAGAAPGDKKFNTSGWTAIREAS
ncbi:hypothetical protein GCM10010260_83190 [Streptomyces filipinensis]|uniref:Uncharacterized protein n=1 Tax=Streptomyces filipinensis TaxID=66887 RepID=A0A918MGK3_9ACTN|nr:hypothetical protein [Streptomyces filipinensis]GGV29972.1 hypothetical protein GCM10010260_83190 [Streptomyces filipinensis]